MYRHTTEYAVCCSSQNSVQCHCGLLHGQSITAAVPQVKQQVLLSATEAAEMILRVDDIVKCAPRQRQE